MLTLKLHDTTLRRVLIEVYKHPNVRTVLGFKGGTAALLFYDLPRYSVDPDFDLLDKTKKDVVFKTLRSILIEFGQLTEVIEKKHTLFYLLRYEKGQRNLKVEVSKRASRSEYEVKQYLGVPMILMKQEDMVANKLVALLTRKTLASRDMFDLWFFLKQNWRIDEAVVTEKTGLSVQQAFEKAIDIAEHVTEQDLMHGVGELLTNKQKDWVRSHLKEKLILELRLYSEQVT